MKASVPEMTPELCLLNAYTAINTLKVGSRRLRRRGKGQIDQLVSNIRRFGCVAPIIITTDLEIVDGHAIAEAAKIVGLTTIPTICISHLCEAELAALSVSLNRIQDMSVWDLVVLKNTFEYLLDVDIDLLSFTGYATPEIDIVLDAVSPQSKADFADELPETRPFIVSRLGDVWLFKGGRRLICGDALDVKTFNILIAEERARLVIGDLPYNVKIRGHVSSRKNAREFAMASGEMTDAEFTGFLRAVFMNLAAHCIDGALNLHFMDWRKIGPMMAAGNEVYSELKNLCVWSKSSAGMGSLWRSQHEPCFAWKVGTAPHINNVALGRHGRNRSNVWEYPSGSSGHRGTDRDAEAHPTPKCVAMIADAILDVTERNDIVLDPTAGSGTTLVAAHRTRRRGYGIEIDPAYVDLAVRRMEKITKAPAHLAGTDLTFEDVSTARINEVGLQTSVVDGQESADFDTTA